MAHVGVAARGYVNDLRLHGSQNHQTDSHPTFFQTFINDNPVRGLEEVESIGARIVKIWPLLGLEQVFQVTFNIDCKG